MTGALILAETGHRREEAEDRDLFVPMAHIAGTTVIKRQIRTLKKAGITRIVVACRPEQAVLEKHLAHLAVELCLCEGDLAEAGLARLPDCDNVAVIKGNIPFFGVDTVERLLAADGAVRVPVWQGQAGAPVLLAGSGIRAAAQGGWEQMERWSRQAADGGASDKISDRTSDEISGRTADEAADGISGEASGGTSDGAVVAVMVDDEGTVLRYHEPEDRERLEEFARQQKDANELGFQVKLILEREEDFFGPGTAAFFLRIQETGSILAACQEMNMSYSKGWKMVNRVEEEMGFRFLVRKNGGKGGGFSQLTPEGEAFVRRYNAFRQDVRQMAENFFEEYFSDFM